MSGKRRNKRIKETIKRIDYLQPGLGYLRVQIDNAAKAQSQPVGPDPTKVCRMTDAQVCLRALKIMGGLNL